MAQNRWRGWAEEATPRRVLFVLTVAVLGAIAVVSLIGTLRGDGLASPWLWAGLLLVPLLLWLVSRVGLGR